MSIGEAERIRNLFLKKEVFIVLSEDETCLCFHETTNIVLVPKGVKRVIIVLSVSEKDGCSVMHYLLSLFSKVFLVKKTNEPIQEHEKSKCSIY